MSDGTLNSRKLVIITLQEKFLQMSYDQVSYLLGDRLAIRPVSLNELTLTPPAPDETILCFNVGVQEMVTRMYPHCCSFILAGREILMWNLKELFCLATPHTILVVNDGKNNTEEMMHDLEEMHLPHTFIGYYPGQPVPDGVDHIVTSGERALIPSELQHIPVIDCGIRFISLETFARLFSHFNIPIEPSRLARLYQKMAVSLSERWPGLGNGRFITPWFGTGRETSSPATFADFVANSASMRKFIDHVRKVAATDQPIHIYGEIGTGKKRICQAIHNGSSRKGGPFITINCAARSRENLERELFGWENDDNPSRSLFEYANGGTLCIEEISALDDVLQARLVQALAEHRITRIGGATSIEINARIITTSSVLFENGAGAPINSDLSLLLKRYICRIPALHERPEDFEAIIFQYLREHLNKAPADIDADTIATLRDYTWQGNVQELYNVLQYMSCTAHGRLTREALPYYITGAEEQRRVDSSPAESAEHAKYQKIRAEIEKHGFLAESLTILETYQAGKQDRTTYGRGPLLQKLREQGIRLTPQQLRLRLEKLDAFGLLIVRPGRRGTTISTLGEAFLNTAQTLAEQGH